MMRLTKQVTELQSDTSTKDDVIGALELELKSVLKFTTSTDTNPKQDAPSSSHQHVEQKSNQKPTKPPIAHPTTSHNGQSKDKLLEKTATRGVIGIVGAEQIGSQLSALLALKGYAIVLIEARQTVVEKSKKVWSKILDSYLVQKRCSKEDVERARQSISYIVSVAAMKSHGESFKMCIDTARDDHKREVLRQIMKYVDPKCVVISHSNAQCITKRASFVAPDRRPRLIGINLLHFGCDLVNNKAIELSPSWHTANDVVARCKEVITKDLERRCVVVRDAAALVSNRLLAVYLNEAFSILECALCSAEEIDAVMDLVMNSKFGPFRMADKIGLNVVRDILEGLHQEYGAQKYVPNALLKQYYRAGRWGRKAGTGVYNYKKQSK